MASFLKIPKKKNFKGSNVRKKKSVIKSKQKKRFKIKHRKKNEQNF